MQRSGRLPARRGTISHAGGLQCLVVADHCKRVQGAAHRIGTSDRLRDDLFGCEAPFPDAAGNFHRRQIQWVHGG